MASVGARGSEADISLLHDHFSHRTRVGMRSPADMKIFSPVMIFLCVLRHGKKAPGTAPIVGARWSVIIRSDNNEYQSTAVELEHENVYDCDCYFRM